MGEESHRTLPVKPAFYLTMDSNGQNPRRGKGRNKAIGETVTPTGSSGVHDSPRNSGKPLGASLRSANRLPAGPDSSGVYRFSFKIPSDFEDSRVVQDQILHAVTSLRFSDNDVFAIRLALEEAMINAIKHGNKLDRSKSVSIDAIVSPEEVEITIQDQGPGFSKADIPDPTLEENLEKNSGRGIMLIEAYMSSAEWSDGGRRLRMRKSREAQLAAS